MARQTNKGANEMVSTYTDGKETTLHNLSTGQAVRVVETAFNTHIHFGTLRGEDFHPARKSQKTYPAAAFNRAKESIHSWLSDGTGE
jgi:hypothetical protein